MNYLRLRCTRHCTNTEFGSKGLCRFETRNISAGTYKSVDFLERADDATGWPVCRCVLPTDAFANSNQSLIEFAPQPELVLICSPLPSSLFDCGTLTVFTVRTNEQLAVLEPLIARLVNLISLSLTLSGVREKQIVALSGSRRQSISAMPRLTSLQLHLDKEEYEGCYPSGILEFGADAAFNLRGLETLDLTADRLVVDCRAIVAYNNLERLVLQCYDNEAELFDELAAACVAVKPLVPLARLNHLGCGKGRNRNVVRWLPIELSTLPPSISEVDYGKVGDFMIEGARRGHYTISLGDVHFSAERQRVQRRHCLHGAARLLPKLTTCLSHIGLQGGLLLSILQVACPTLRPFDATIVDQVVGAGRNSLLEHQQWLRNRAALS